MRLIEGYWKSHGKVPDGKEEDRILFSEPLQNNDYGAKYRKDLIVRIDIDDYDHKTGILVDAVKGKPRSEAVLQYLNDNGYKYTAIKTEHGVHIVMLKPEEVEIKNNKLNWYCALGIKLEAHILQVHTHLQIKVQV